MLRFMGAITCLSGAVQLRGASITVAFILIGVHSNITPKAFYSKAQGRRAPRRSRGRGAPWDNRALKTIYAEGVIPMGVRYVWDSMIAPRVPLSNVFGVKIHFGELPRVALRLPWSLGYNAFGVSCIAVMIRSY